MEINAEQFGKAFDTAPRPVRSFIIDGGLSTAIAGIVASRALHVDVAGVLQTGASQMLVGIMSPSQLLGELVLAGVDGETGKKILEDLNQQIFIPVRDKVRHFTETGEDLISPPDVDEENTPAATPVVSPQATPIPPQPPQAAPQPVAPTPTPEEPAQYAYPKAAAVAPPPVEPPIYQGPPPAIPQASYQPVPVEVAHPPVQVPVHPASHAPEPLSSAPPYGEHPSMRTMATDMREAQTHPEATPLYTEQVPSAPVARPQAFAPVPAAPALPLQTAPVAETPTSVTPPTQRIVPPPPNLPGAPLLKQYGSDPYREPLS